MRSVLYAGQEIEGIDDGFNVGELRITLKVDERTWDEYGKRRLLSVVGDRSVDIMNEMDPRTGWGGENFS